MIKKYFLFWLLAFIFLASSWSLFHPGFFRVHDYVHGARIAEMYRGLAEGQFPVRWSENFGYGYGMPLYLFYAPLPYYVGALFYWLSFDLVLSVRLLFLLANGGTIIGGYLLGRKLFGTTGGVLVSAAIALAPYRAVNLFVRGAVSEAWAIMFMPFILYFGMELLSQKPTAKKSSLFAGLVLSVAGLMLSHNLTTLMFVPLSFIFLAMYSVLIKRQATLLDSFKRVAVVTFGYLLAGGLSAFYMVPAVMEKDLTQIESILSGYFHYSHHFLYIRQFFNPTWGYGGSEWGPDDGISFFLGWGQWLGLVVVTVLVTQTCFHYLKKKTSFKSLRLQLVLFSLSSLVVGVSLYLSLLKSKWLWDIFPLLPFIQFPWRWLSVTIIFVALLTGLATQFLNTKKSRWLYGGVLLLTLVFNAQYFRPERYLDDAAGYYYADEQRIREQMSDILPDYLPKDLKVRTDPTQPEASYLAPRQEEELVREADEVKTKIKSILVDKGHQKMLSIDLPEATPLTFAVAYFPGWQAEVDGQAVDVSASATGLVEVWVPAEEHTVAIFFGRTPVRVLADIMSLVSLLLFIFILLPISRFNKNQL
ncbi:MAG TPA: 6-pyruvoyl-tetrahydropterin synthase-related protein [Patescibacteria group bacterium]